MNGCPRPRVLFHAFYSSSNLFYFGPIGSTFEEKWEVERMRMIMSLLTRAFSQILPDMLLDTTLDLDHILLLPHMLHQATPQLHIHQVEVRQLDILHLVDIRQRVTLHLVDTRQRVTLPLEDTHPLVTLPLEDTHPLVTLPLEHTHPLVILLLVLILQLVILAHRHTIQVMDLEWGLFWLVAQPLQLLHMVLIIFHMVTPMALVMESSSMANLSMGNLESAGNTACLENTKANFSRDGSDLLTHNQSILH